MKTTMKTTLLAITTLLLAARVNATEPPWSPSAVKPCDRACLTGIMDRYTDALWKHDRSALPLAEDVRFTENTALLNAGEGILWHARTEPTAFKYYVADPVAGQVAIGTVVKVQGRPALVAIRLKVERGRLLEIEHLIDRNVQERQMANLQTPRAALLNDIAAADRTSREGMIAAANSYFDAIEGDSGKIGAFAEDCERHENGIQTTLTKEPTTGMLASGPPSKLYMMTCSDQLDTKIFAYIHKIRPRRVLIVDEQKGLVATFPLFVHDGSRRGDSSGNLGMLINMVCLETFGIRGGKIHEVEAFPFVQIPYGLGDGWTPGSGR
jgi:hypothetical protein